MSMNREEEQAIRESLRTGITGERRMPGLEEFTVTKTDHTKKDEPVIDLVEGQDWVWCFNQDHVLPVARIPQCLLDALGKDQVVYSRQTVKIYVGLDGEIKAEAVDIYDY